ncbi:uncharacterized protein PAC_11557 [Phialocephala subalpina]|uniref:Uncharacterized protein n=1 Tax=Phialocephala subalpina TaxID=576137 RepID=A0A1L7X9G5_9HELO|nr:uncharacterized protein PAC_11557 [Phialocephala subalpina]
MERKPKTIYQLDTPFTQVEWPKISDTDQTHIFELLCSTLKPIGLYRTNHVTPSKGKRSQNSKRQEAKAKASSNPDVSMQGSSSAPPPPPEIQKHVVVGLNSILRHLQSLSSKSKPGQELRDSGVEVKEGGDDTEGKIEGGVQEGHFATIFALPSSPPNILTHQLPILIHTASLSSPSLSPTRLIPLSIPQASQLATTLSMARVSHIGILDSAPGTEWLLKLMRETVPEIEVKWLDDMKKGVYLSVKINAVETFIGVSRKEVRDKEKGKGKGKERVNEDEIDV